MAAIAVKSSFVRRLMGAAVLDTGTYEEIEADPNATAQALVVILLSSAAAGIGGTGFGSHTLSTIVLVSIAALLVWAAWALLTFEIGVRLMPQPATRSSVGELMRTIGFASTPGLLRIAGILPGTTVTIYTISAVWMLAAMVVAVRQALDYDNTMRAVWVCGLGLILALSMAVAFGVVFGPSVV